MPKRSVCNYAKMEAMTERWNDDRLDALDVKVDELARRLEARLDRMDERMDKRLELLNVRIDRRFKRIW